MLDFIRNLTKTEAERLDERISGYLDGTLSQRDQERLERRMAADPALRTEVQQMQAIRGALRRMPRRRAPRNFTLSPAQAGQLVREPSWTPYPILRTATVVVALILAMVLVFDLGFSRGGLAQPAAETVMIPQDSTGEEAALAVEELPVEEAEAEPIEAFEVAVTRVVEVETEAELAPEAAVVTESEAQEETARAEEAPAEAPEAEEAVADVVEEGVGATQPPLGAQQLPAGGEGEPDAGSTRAPQATQAPQPTEAFEAAEVVETEQAAADAEVAAAEQAIEDGPVAVPTVTLIPVPTITSRPSPMPVATEVPTPIPPTLGLDRLTLVEIGLGTVALLLAALTLFFRRRV